MKAKHIIGVLVLAVAANLIAKYIGNFLIQKKVLPPA